MNWVDWYLPARHLHIGAVVASLALFAARGAAVLAGAAWPMQAVVRRTSVVIDTALLGAALVLWAMLGLNPLRDAWLGTKIALLLLYIGLGSFALKRAPTRGAKALFYAAALATATAIVVTALTRRPFGVAFG